MAGHILGAKNVGMVLYIRPRRFDLEGTFVLFRLEIAIYLFLSHHFNTIAYHSRSRLFDPLRSVVIADYSIYGIGEIFVPLGIADPN